MNSFVLYELVLPAAVALSVALLVWVMRPRRRRRIDVKKTEGQKDKRIRKVVRQEMRDNSLAQFVASIQMAFQGLQKADRIYAAIGELNKTERWKGIAQAIADQVNGKGSEDDTVPDPEPEPEKRPGWWARTFRGAA